jgi:hypothetical protein
MRKLMNVMLTMAVLAIFFVSCDKGSGSVEEGDTAITENISVNTTWKTGNVYRLGGRIAILPGITLTIEPGVIIKGEAGTGPNATALLVAKGATLIAEGTVAQPIIFTSVADEIMPGEIASPNLDPTLNGLWGGLIVLGNAPISADAASVQIEGIPASDQNGLYGGDDPADNSGILKYISIRHGGANIGEGNEINGLTLGGVGSGTVIENIEIVSNQDDGIEWFGGAVNVKNVVVWNTGDDAIDTDQAWAGTLNNFAIVNPGDECFELDGGEGDFNEMHTITNGTVYAGNAEGLADLDDKGPAGTVGNSYVDMSNIYFLGVKYGQDFDDNPSDLSASNLELVLPSDTLTIADFFKKGTDIYVTAVDSGANTVGADMSVLKDWSWAGVSGALNGL